VAQGLHEKDRNLRYQHASEVHTDLQRLKRDTFQPNKPDFNYIRVRAAKAEGDSVNDPSGLPLCVAATRLCPAERQSWLEEILLQSRFQGKRPIVTV